MMSRNGMSYRKREIKERSIKVEVIFSGNESIVRWKKADEKKQLQTVNRTLSPLGVRMDFL